MRKLITRVLTVIVTIALLESPIQASGLKMVREFTRTVLIEFGKKQIEVALSDITKYFYPVVTVSCYVNQYKRTEVVSYPNQPLKKTVWTMTIDHQGNTKWLKQVWTNGVALPSAFIDSNTPGIQLHFWKSQCPWIHNSITYHNDLTEEFSIVGRAKVENYSSLIKDRRPDSVSFRATTEAYKLLDPCSETSFNEFDPNRVDVEVVAVGTVPIDSKGIGTGKWTYFSPTPFLSYNHEISIDEIFIGGSGGN